MFGDYLRIFNVNSQPKLVVLNDPAITIALLAARYTSTSRFSMNPHVDNKHKLQGTLASFLNDFSARGTRGGVAELWSADSSLSTNKRGIHTGFNC